MVPRVAGPAGCRPGHLFVPATTGGTAALDWGTIRVRLPSGQPGTV